jgi:hypothetical protein
MFVTSLSDAGQPYSCESWQSNFGSSDAPLVIDENQSSTGMFSLFHDSWNAFPTFAILDHTMTVRAKPWTLDSNTNTNSCDGTSQTINGWSGGNTSNFLQQLVDECGSLCEPCQDTNDTDGDGIGDECDDCHNLLGDVNDDMNHDILDIVTTVNIILAGGVGSGEFTECEETDADMDSNGAVNILDVIQIINLILDNRAIHESGNVEVGISKNGLDFYLHINSDVSFTGFQLQINGEYPNLSMDDNDHINLVSRVKNGQTYVIAYSADNEPFKNDFAGIHIAEGGVIEGNDLNIMVSSPAGEALTVVNMGSISQGTPNKFGLTSVYPNPFNPTTSVSFTLSDDSKIKLSVFDVRGNEVDIVFSDNLNAGEHTFTWDASDFASGVYYIQLNSASYSSMMKALLIK